MGVRRGSECASAQLTQYILGKINTRKGVGRLLVQLLLLAAAGYLQRGKMLHYLHIYLLDFRKLRERHRSREITLPDAFEIFVYSHPLLIRQRYTSSF